MVDPGAQSSQTLPVERCGGFSVEVGGSGEGLTLVLGGARSGKSRHAEGLVTAGPAPWLYVATAQAFDEEMQSRIEEHRARRAQGWLTLEAPVELAALVAREGVGGASILVDCATLWLSNMLLAGREVDAEVNGLLAALAGAAARIVVVSNEVGQGIVPDNALARAFRDHQGRLNQRLAAQAGRVILTVAGLPLTLK